MNEYIHKYLTIKEKKGMESNKRIIVSGGGWLHWIPSVRKTHSGRK